jgi:uncharacterized membrane protein YjjP (DUF1212 family)
MEEKNLQLLEEIHSYKEIMMLLEICANSGALLLRNGAEIYRVEDTVERIVRSRKNVKDVDVYSTTNVLMVSFNVDGQIYSNVRRVKDRRTNLIVVDRVNSFSRKFCSGGYTLEEGLKELEIIKNKPGISKRLNTFGAALSAAALTVLLGGNFNEGIVAFFVSLVSWILTMYIGKNNLGYFIENFLSGIVVSSFTIIFTKALSIEVMDNIFIGAMMPYVPGFFITNSVRDMMGGDTTTGLTGMTQAILISAALALGVAIPIDLFL